MSCRICVLHISEIFSCKNFLHIFEAFILKTHFSFTKKKQQQTNINVLIDQIAGCGTRSEKGMAKIVSKVDRKMKNNKILKYLYYCY